MGHFQQLCSSTAVLAKPLERPTAPGQTPHVHRSQDHLHFHVVVGVGLPDLDSMEDRNGIRFNGGTLVPYLVGGFKPSEKYESQLG